MTNARNEILVPAMGESVSEATLARWMKAEGSPVAMDEPLVELETDKVTLEVCAPASGVLESILIPVGETVTVGTLLGYVREGATSPSPSPELKPQSSVSTSQVTSQVTPQLPEGDEVFVLPAARKLMAENNLSLQEIAGTGKGGRVLKEDVLRTLEGRASPVSAGSAEEPVLQAEVGPLEKAPEKILESVPEKRGESLGERREERIPMSRLRQRIAQRLKEAQNTAAILTTFNEIDMSAVMALRDRLKDSFEKKHGVKLGFMSFFTHACRIALQEIPALNAEIQGDTLVYRNYYDIGVAVGTPQGLVVPVVRDVQTMGFAEIEKEIARLGAKARDGKLTLDDLSGGTFTISNGGVYGSLLSTPIINPPQSGILGMHKIQKRPVAVGDQVVIRPMMYVALSYDHRIVDGREAVTFLIRVKEKLEEPERMLLAI